MTTVCCASARVTVRMTTDARAVRYKKLRRTRQKAFRVTRGLRRATKPLRAKRIKRDAFDFDEPRVGG